MERVDVFESAGLNKAHEEVPDASAVEYGITYEKKLSSKNYERSKKVRILSSSIRSLNILQRLGFTFITKKSSASEWPPLFSPNNWPT